MKRIVAIVAALVLLVAGVGYAAEAAVPTLADVMKAITELKADVATLKADGWTRANASGQLAKESTKDGLVMIEVTSVTAGQDGAIVGLKITNKTTDKHVDLNTLMGTSVVAAGKQVKILHDEGFTGPVLPGTTQQGVLLLEPLPKGTTEITVRTTMYDDKTFGRVLESTMLVKLPK